MSTNTNETSNRRGFLIHILKKSGQLTLATTAIYTISLLSSNEKFGGMTAGAKTWKFESWTFCGNPNSGFVVEGSACGPSDVGLLKRCTGELCRAERGTCKFVRCK